MLVNILVFFGVLSLLVLVHELGHFFVAKRAGIWVEEFGFGLPPRIWGKKFKQTLFSLNLLPFGGFVKLHGEGSEEGISKPKRAFLNKSKKARVAVLLAGVVMNFLLGIFAFAIVYSFSGIPREALNVRVVDVVPGSPAQTSGLLFGDVVRKIDKKTVSSTKSFMEEVDRFRGGSVVLEVENDSSGETKSRNITVKPRQDPPSGEGPLGVAISTVEIYYPPVWQRPFYGAYFGFKDAVYWVQTDVT